MPKISDTGCPDLSLIISTPFTLEMCVESQKLQKNHQSFWEVQGHSKLSMLTSPKSSSLVLLMTSSMSVVICNSFHAREATTVK